MILISLAQKSRSDLWYYASEIGRRSCKKLKNGRPKKNEAVLKWALRLYHSKEYSIKEIAEITGVSRATL
nr:helix-turn-helix domain-containing protein [Rossellomorea vietnamensis]